MAPAGERAADPTRRPGLTADERRHRPCPPGGRPQSGTAAVHEVGRQILTDHPGAEYHALQTGHFALKDKAAEIAALMRDFLARTVPCA